MSELFTADRRAADFWWRVAAVVAAAACAALGASSWATTPLCLIAAVAAVQCLARRRRAGWLDAVAFGVGGLLIALVLTGLLLDVVPGGITRLSWSIALGVVGLAAVGYGATGTRAHAVPSRSDAVEGIGARLRGAPWYVAALVLAAVAIGISVHATRSSQVTPVQLSAVGRDAGAVRQIQVQGGETSGRYVLVVGRGQRITEVVGPFDVAAGATVRRSVRVPDDARSTLQLRPYGSADAIRTLVLQRGSVGQTAAEYAAANGGGDSGGG